MGDLFDFQDEKRELSQLVAGAVDEEKCGHTGDSAHVGPETGSQPTGIKRGREQNLPRTRSESCAGKELRGN